LPVALERDLVCCAEMVLRRAQSRCRIVDPGAIVLCLGMSL
jgi:hypothetical protein